jgi:hypothetical protein
MRHITLTLFIASSSLLFGACQKDYTCKCEGVPDTITEYINIENTHIDEAKSICEQKHTQMQSIDTAIICGLN